MNVQKISGLYISGCWSLLLSKIFYLQNRFHKCISISIIIFYISEREQRNLNPMDPQKYVVHQEARRQMQWLQVILFLNLIVFALILFASQDNLFQLLYFHFFLVKLQNPKPVNTVQRQTMKRNCLSGNENVLFKYGRPNDKMSKKKTGQRQIGNSMREYSFLFYSFVRLHVRQKLHSYNFVVRCV